LLRKRSERIVSLTEALADYHAVKARAPRRKGR
jgi:hypothetical protein